eukprot:6178678-Pleurochrysis_carterae.AAC.2
MPGVPLGELGKSEAKYEEPSRAEALGAECSAAGADDVVVEAAADDVPVVAGVVVGLEESMTEPHGKMPKLPWRDGTERYCSVLPRGDVSANFEARGDVREEITAGACEHAIWRREGLAQLE